MSEFHRSSSSSAIPPSLITTWSEKSTDFNAAIQNGYFCNDTLTATLPPSAGLTIGDVIIIYHDAIDDVDVVTVQAGAGEFIQIGENISASGGSFSSDDKGSMLELIFKPSDLTWHTISSVGSWNP